MDISLGYDLTRTKKVMETKRRTTANRKLYDGWVLVGLVPLEDGFLYCLALPGRKVSLIEEEIEKERNRRAAARLLE